MENKQEEVKPSPKIDINKYQDSEGLTMQKLDIGLWWVKNKKKLKNYFIVFWIIVSAANWGFVIYKFANYLFFEMGEEKKMYSELAQTRTISQEDLIKLGAKEPALSSVGIIENNEKYDLYIVATNPNSKYLGTMDYCFEEGSKKISCGTDFIFPNERKYISAISEKIDYRPKNIKFVLINMSWKRINAHKITDWASYKEEHLDFEIKDLKFTQAKTSGLSEKVELSSLEFTIANKTPYSYWEAPLTILLFNNNRIVGINKYTLKDFFSNNQQKVKIIWPDIANVGDIEIIPNINIINNDVYIKP